jgi:hypothetical protein
MRLALGRKQKAEMICRPLPYHLAMPPQTFNRGRNIPFWAVFAQAILHESLFSTSDRAGFGGYCSRFVADFHFQGTHP